MEKSDTANEKYLTSFFLLLFVSCKNYFTNHMYKIVRKNTIHVFLYIFFFPQHW